MAMHPQSNSSTVLTVIAVALVAFGLGWFVGSKNVQTAGEAPQDAAVGAAAAPSEGNAQDSTKIPLADSPVYGKASAPIAIVDFSSLQCPFCAKANATLKELVKKYPNDVKIVSKNFPLAFQQQSRPAAKAALAAGEQGKFWEMKQKLFDSMREFRGADMKELTAGYAKELGLDVEKFKKDFDNAKFDEIIDRDMKLGQSLGVRGTPHFFINGERVSGAQPIEKFEEVIKRQLAEAKEMLSAGVSRDAIYAKMVDKNYQAAPQAPEKAKPSAPQAAEVHMMPVQDFNATKGAKADDALVTVIEFSSFQCPYCARGAETMRALAKKYGKNVRFVYKNFPLAFQKASEPAARAALAAAEQGKFWEYYDLLYENQRSLAQPNIFEDLAKRVGLNVDKFKKDMDDPKMAERVKTDQADGSKAGVRGTPAFFVNGIKLVGAKPQAEFEKEIDEQLKIAEKIQKEKKLKGDALYKAVVEYNQKNKKAAAPAPAQPPAPAPKVDTKELVVGNSYAKGPENAPVTIFEFSSFQCPYCSRGADTLKQIKEQYGDKVRVVYKNFPLAFQAQSEPAARAALAAGEQGKFWEYYDQLYKTQRQFSQPNHFENLAKQIGLNMDKFNKDFNDPKIAEQVKADQAMGSKLGVRGTPAFFINGNRLVGAQPIEKFKEVIDAELKK